MICPIETPKLINFLSMPSALQLSMLVPKAADEEAVESAIKKVGSNFFINGPVGVAPSVGKIKKRNLFKKFSKESIKFN